jgi:hypothetical protein
VTAEQQFWNAFYGWSLAGGLVIMFITVLFIGSNLKLFTDVIARRQQHKHRMAEMKMRGQLVHAGMDPSYVEFLTKQLGKQEKGA